MKKACLLIIFIFFLVPEIQAQTDAETIVKNAFDYWRGKASISTTAMTIHRPDWERTMTIKAWTKGTSDSLFVITEPAKDRGNSTLKINTSMWIYNPKINRVIKLPPSMMSQSWQGSDFSNNDLAKSDSLLKDYTHTLIHTTPDTDVDQERIVYTIKSMPKPAAPVVWGMIILKIRQDNILLSQEFFDENLESVKIMTAWDIQMRGDKLFPIQWKMQQSDAMDEYTLLIYDEIDFKETLDKRIFTLTNLKNPQI